MILKRFDTYIIKKFLGTYFLSIILIISIAVVFDISEKLDNFYENEAPLRAIIFDYYVNFIPYYANLFSPLFTFIAVIFFTSKMADNSEIIATFASGISFHRMMVPYLISASIIASMTYILGGYVIPPANKIRLDFQEEYVRKKKKDFVAKLQIKVSQNEILYVDYFDHTENTGHRVSLDQFNGKTLVSRITGHRLIYDTTNVWKITRYTHREFDGLYENISQGDTMEKEINIIPADLLVFPNMHEQMNNRKLSAYIERQKERGVGNIKNFEIEYEKRFSFPFAAFILTIIGVSLSSKKVKGGMGINLGIGLLLSIVYILFGEISSTFTINGSLPPMVAVWLPNIVFSLIAVYLYKKAPK